MKNSPNILFKTEGTKKLRMKKQEHVASSHFPCSYKKKRVYQFYVVSPFYQFNGFPRPFGLTDKQF